MLFCLCVDFLALKSGHRREKQPVLGPVCHKIGDGDNLVNK